MPFRPVGLLGHIAIYSLNLLLLRTVLHPDGYEVDCDEVASRGGAPGTWDQLTHVWRSWFSLDGLRELSAIWTATRKGASVRLTAKAGALGARPSSERLEVVRDVGLALADGVTAGLAGLVGLRRWGGPRERMEDARRRLKESGIEMPMDQVLGRLAYSEGVWRGYGERLEAVEKGFELVGAGGASEGEVVELLVRAGECGAKGLVVRYWGDIERRAGEGNLFRHPGFVVALLRAAIGVDDGVWLRRLDERLRAAAPRDVWGVWGGRTLVTLVGIVNVFSDLRGMKAVAARFLRSHLDTGLLWTS